MSTFTINHPTIKGFCSIFWDWKTQSPNGIQLVHNQLSSVIGSEKSSVFEMVQYCGSVGSEMIITRQYLRKDGSLSASVGFRKHHHSSDLGPDGSDVYWEKGRLDCTF